MTNRLMKNEEWVVGYEGLYSVTTQGSVFSFSDGSRSELAKSLDSYGYYIVSLWSDGNVEKKRVHRIVLLAFVGEPNNDEEARHLNDRPTDNRLCNLSWGTREDNYDDARKNRSHSRGELHGHSKMTEEMVKELRNRYDENEDLSIRDLLDEYPVGHSSLCAIIRGDRWQHVEGPTTTSEMVLTDEEVREIRNRYKKEDITQEYLAEHYDVSLSYIVKIIHYKNRKDA